MTGVFNKRPPKPRYSGTWEVSLVTGLFEKWPVNSNLELKRLSRKYAMLFALTSAKRQSDLHALDLAFVQFLPESRNLRIPGLTKTSASEKMLSSFSQPLKTVFSCAQWPVSGNILRRQQSFTTIAVLISLYF